MASVSKIFHTVIPQTHAKLSMLLPISNKLIVRVYGNGGDACPPPSGPTMYDCRKIHHQLSKDEVQPCFETLQNIPTGVFRETSGEVLGMGAGKGCTYQNPEYFSFHHMSFFDLNMGLRQYRLPCPKSGRKPN